MMLIVLTFITQQMTLLPSLSVFVFLHQSATLHIMTCSKI